jgi:hypothetical protein
LVFGVENYKGIGKDLSRILTVCIMDEKLGKLKREELI